MSILKGNRTITRFSIDTEQPDLFLDKPEQFLDGQKFTDPKTNNSNKKKIGWVTLQSVIDNHFTANNCSVNHWVFAQLRIDEKKVQRKIFNAKVQEKIEEMKIACSVDKLFKKDIDEIKDSIKIQMLNKIAPKVKTIEFVWNTKENYILVFTASQSAIEDFTNHFQKTFNMFISKDSPIVNQDCSKFRSWLFYSSEISPIDDGEEYELNFGGKYVFGTSHNSVTFDSMNAVIHPAFKNLIRQGVDLWDYRVCFEKNGTKFIFDLKGEDLRIRNLNVIGAEDAIAPESIEEENGTFLLRMDEYELVYSHLLQWVEIWKKEKDDLQFLSRKQQYILKWSEE